MFTGKNKKTSPLIISAHLDTVFPEKTDLAVNKESGKVRAPGIGDNASVWRLYLESCGCCVNAGSS